MGGRQTIAVDFPDEGLPHKFGNQYDALTVSVAFAEAAQAHAEQTAAAVVKNLTAIAPCPAASAEPACASAFIDTYGARAYRRPLDDADRARLSGVFATVREKADYSSAIQAVVETMLQSPHFLFRTELGVPASTTTPIVRLTGYEIASELSYLVWSSAPDDPLLGAAQAGRLATVAGLESEARRLLDDPRAKGGIGRLLSQWVEASDLDRRSLDSKSYPSWSPALARSAMGELERLGEQTVLDGKLADLFTTTRAVIDAPLAQLYGAPAPRGTGAQEISLDPTRRAGFLTSAAFLAANSSPTGFSPVFFGRFLRRRVLCQALPDPPANVPPLPPASEPLTTRERFAQHSKDPGCAACHRLMDPLGFGFERYDALGQYRESETTPLGVSKLTGDGELVGTDVDGTFSGPVELGRRLATSANVEACVAAQVLELALGRDVTAQDGRRAIDGDAIAGSVDRLRVAQGQMRALILGVVTSDAFVLRDRTGLL